MISRKATGLIADLYYETFTIKEKSPESGRYTQKDKELYRFFFEENYPPELLKELEIYCDHYHPDELVKFIMGLETGESIESFAHKYNIQEDQYKTLGQSILTLLVVSILKHHINLKVSPIRNLVDKLETQLHEDGIYYNHFESKLEDLSAKEGRKVMSSIQDIVYILLDTMTKAPQDEWKDRGAAGWCGFYVKRLVELSGLSEDRVNVGLEWLNSNSFIKVIIEDNPRANLTYRWVPEITSRGKLFYEEMKEKKEMAEKESSQPAEAAVARDTSKVFVVHGRNEKARKALFIFLRSIGLSPQEWSQWVESTKQGSPYVGEVLKKGFETAQAFVILLTPDDEAQLREPLRSDHEETYETTLTPQARPNVIYEAGMAMGVDERRTILIELGKLRPISDIFGRHVIRLNNTPQKRKDLAQRLASADCPVDLRGNDWLDAGDFDAALEGL